MKHPQREALIERIQDAREHPNSPFERRMTAACTELRAARNQVRARHGEVILREAEREVFGPVRGER